ncbi:universal stress protein [Mucilaginibacter sp. S1162]|uniref:Universal stress protein n=1 Tax=Mucilaginibacter humi TaxID=2732510 RepID=A0ABX1VZW3_9SPHI|nr:universal stress protein [Mucilaginibacter humi]NNU33400.1 universal stress protein [Mucilaginibacter humi]
MKKILVLTDFSATAAHAARYALQLAQQLHTGILLYHVVQSIPIVPNYAGGGFVTETENLFAEESRENLTKLKDQLTAGRQDGPAIDTRTGEGDPGSNIKALLRDEPIELIVMGAPEGSVVEHLLIGSETRAVIKASDRPVLVVPANEQFNSIQKLVLATDYRSEDLCALRYLSNWVANTGGKLDVVHIQTAGEEALLNAQQKKVFELFLDNLGQTNVHCHDLRGKEIRKA